MFLRNDLENEELGRLSEFACKSVQSRGRAQEEAPEGFRTCFQRDRDRIIHTKALRRLMHKTQVFLSPEGDHYTTRLTHTLEVAQIARTIARALTLNEDLTEAIAMGHDLGHTPFGHMGERFLDKRHNKGFEHNVQSLRVVDVLEKNYKGKTLNLTFEVRDGIVNHTGNRKPITLEGQVVKFSDRIAYINHDIDDAIRAGVISQDDIPERFLEGLGYNHGSRINYLVRDIVENSDGKPEIIQSQDVGKLMSDLREWMFKNVYENPNVRANSEMAKVKNLIYTFYDYFLEHPELLDKGERLQAETDGLEEVVKDRIAGMTDRYAINLYNDLFVPSGWNQ